MTFNVFRSQIELATEFIKMPDSLKNTLKSTLDKFPDANRIQIEVKAYDKLDKELDINSLKMSLGSILFEVLKGGK